MASWNYCQFKCAKKNLLAGEVIIVHDFAQNYVCLLQNEPQGLHWDHKQVTLHTTVVYYKSTTEDCDKLVTHELVHVSDDLKHNAHLVNKFHKLLWMSLSIERYPYLK